MESEEEWRYNEDYKIDVSTHGRYRNPNTGKLIGYPNGRRLQNGQGHKEAVSVNRYIYVSLPLGARRRTMRAHIITLETFVGPRPTGYEADHIDHDGMNNHIDNLRWISKEENQNRRRKRANRSSTTT